MADDPLTAALADMRERVAERDKLIERMKTGALGAVGIAEFNAAQDRLAGFAPQALAAVEAALGHHERVSLYGNAATEEEPGNCPHHPDSDLHFEDGDGSGEWLCEGKPEGAVCSSCVDGEGGERVDWPCPEYEAILAALTGPAADHG